MWRAGCESVPVPVRLFLYLVKEHDDIGKIDPAVAIEIHNACRLVCANPA
jgi:hypothetical protein